MKPSGIDRLFCAFVGSHRQAGEMCLMVQSDYDMQVSSRSVPGIWQAGSWGSMTRNLDRAPELVPPLLGRGAPPVPLR